MMTKKIEGTFPEDSSTESSTVGLGVFEQVKWERDVAIQQLEELGYGLGEKIRTDEDCISREAALNALYALCDTGEKLKENPWRDNPHIDAVVETIEQLPSVRPTEMKGGTE